jgi:serine protease Do
MSAVKHPLLILLLGLCIGLALFPLLNRSSSNTSAVSTSIETSRRNAIVRAIENVAPAVVSINTVYDRDYPRYPDRFFEPLEHFSDKQRIPGIGSGFVIQTDGYILTSSHVVDGAKEIFVIFPDGRGFDVLGVFIDRQWDLAVVQIDADSLYVPEIGTSESVIIGEWAIALGNPFGLHFEDLNPTVTVGVISAVDRIVRPEQNERAYKGMIQTDASINPGNSGGPLVNSLGRVIGVNSFIFSQGGSLGIGFAVPIDRAIQVASQLIDQGSREFWTGLDIHNLNSHIARTLGVLTIKGALITVVDPLSPGESAGLLPGDVIVMVNDKHTSSADDVVDAFRHAAVGDTFILKILRKILRGQGRVFDAQLVLEADPRNE